MDTTKKYSFPTLLDILAIMSIFVLFNFLGALIMPLFKQYASAGEGLALFLSYNFQFLSVIILTLVLKRIRAKGQKVFNFSLKGANPRIILWGLLLTVSVSILIEPVISLFPDYYLDMLSNLGAGSSWFMLTSVVVAPVLEEVFFRGMLQSAISHRIGRWSSLLVTSLIFGLVHVIPPQALNAFAVSLVLGYLFIRTNSLLCVIIIHALNNVIAYFTMLLNDGNYISMRDLIANEMLYKGVYLIAASIFMVAVISIIVIFRTKKDKKKKE